MGIFDNHAAASNLIRNNQQQVLVVILCLFCAVMHLKSNIIADSVGIALGLAHVLVLIVFLSNIGGSKQNAGGWVT